VHRAVVPAAPGVITAVDARALGLLLVELGGGRRRDDDAVDLAVGLADVAGVGDRAGKEQPLAVIHARTAAQADAAAGVLRRAMTIGEAPVAASRSPVLRRMSAPPTAP
jgi:thymidine phosphorylase